MEKGTRGDKMALEITSGKGHLYDTESRRLVAEVNYNLKYSPDSEAGESTWHGSLTVNRELGAHGEFVIEFADGRRGNCYLNRGLKTMGGMPAVFHYNYRGQGNLTA
jgi:hypothetical protein